LALEITVPVSRTPPSTDSALNEISIGSDFGISSRAMPIACGALISGDIGETPQLALEVRGN